MARIKKPHVPPAVFTTEEQQKARELNEKFNAWSRQLLPAVCPIYHPDRHGNPIFVGSSVLLRFGARSFLVTAAHVMDYRRTARLYAAGEGQFAELEGVAYTTRSSEPGREDDNLDLAVFPLSDQQVRDLGPSRFLGPDDLAPGEPTDPTRIFGTRFMLLGYPASKQPKLIDTELIPIPQTLAAYPSPVSLYSDRGLDPRHHVLLEYDRETMFNTRGRVTGPKPHGMSGGGAWTIDLFGFRRLDRPRLVSILIEYHDAPHHTITSTRIGLCIDVIGDHFPDLKPLLPKPGPLPYG